MTETSDDLKIPPFFEKFLVSKNSHVSNNQSKFFIKINRKSLASSSASGFINLLPWNRRWLAWGTIISLSGPSIRGNFTHDHQIVGIILRIGRPTSVRLPFDGVHEC